MALLIVDAGIQPLTGAARGGIPPEALADPRRIADAVLFLANQDARAATHELQLTPLAETWTPNRPVKAPARAAASGRRMHSAFCSATRLRSHAGSLGEALLAVRCPGSACASASMTARRE